MNRIAMHRSMVALLVSTSIGLAACSSTTASDGAPTADSPDLSVAANFYPVEWLVTWRRHWPSDLRDPRPWIC